MDTEVLWKIVEPCITSSLTIDDKREGGLCEVVGFVGMLFYL